jgi:Flp pilus assembly CpaE family ATPase
MWQALNLKNLSEQASNLVAQATEKSGELISQAQDSLRKISNDNDNQVINEDQVISGITIKKLTVIIDIFYSVNPFYNFDSKPRFLSDP